MNNNRKRKVGILGGTFDPIHTGHLFIAQTALDEAALDEVIFIPSGCPPHKKNNEVTKASCRLQMVTEAIGSNPYFSVSELDINKNKTGYTYDLLILLTEKYPEVSFYFIMGADSFMEIKTWYRYDELLTMVGFIVMKRKGYNSEEMDYQTGIFKKTHQTRIVILDSPKLEISSSEIRNRIKTNKSIKYLLPEKVEMYIYQNHLYDKD
ncbi:nicotinate-nucleotide adenylyltransferase [Tindallia californiensis]|uniref:Probable nicotinate-nucleotide adenylyltransferase n=1 Tax=Tindallia californiensis TaxID=159292 RepID=A0A1H3NCP7_9FIRM|nr:nicotinate-nucleotide adenylyltransferase [Tindallia californiensis]SDY86638.1 nicotinate-nucleotide adenylyltransferase [Tindallia californiensis]